MAIVFNDNIQTNTPKSLDSRYAVYESGQTRPYNNTLEVTNRLDLSVRYIGLTVLVGTDEYWFKSGILDNNLIKKTIDVDTNNFVTINTNQTITGIKTFTQGTIFNTDINVLQNIYVADNLFTNLIPVFNRDENDIRYILASPGDQQIANINLLGSIGNSNFLVQDNGATSWLGVATISEPNGVSILKNKPINFYGSVAQNMQIKNDDTGLIISNTLNQTKFKFSDGGILSLSQTPSNGPVGAPTLVRNPITGNIELGVATSSGFVDLTTDQSIAGNKTFSSLGSSTLNGTLNITSGVLSNTTYSDQIAYWDIDGNLVTGTVPTITSNNGLTKTGNNITLGGSLLQTTVIDTNGNNFIIGGTGGAAIDGTTVQITAGNSTYGIQLNGGTGANKMFIFDGRSAGLRKGLEEPEDWSTNKTDYSYVTKKMLVVQEVDGILEFRLAGDLVMKLDSDGLKLKSGLEVYPNNF